MSVAQLVVSVTGLVAIAWVLWYFLLSPGPGASAATTDGVQAMRVTVKGGYTPDTIVVRAGTPVRLDFYRAETADCSERLVLERFGIDVALPAFQTTSVTFTPEEAGEFPFRCGMHMLKGVVVVEPATVDRQPSASPHPLHE